MSNFMSNDDALQVLGTYAEDIKKGKGVIAVRETSPATAAHSVGEYIRYNGTTYKVKSAISIGDSLILNTNIEANGLPDGMTIFTPESSSGGSGECDLFLIQLTGSGTVGSPYAVDVTPAELGDALDAGKYPVIMQYDNSEYVSYPFTWMEDDRLIFEFERLEDHQINGDYHTVRSNKVRLEVDGTDWDTISIVTRDFDLTTKADKVSGATNGNFASLDANGNLADSGKKASDFVLASAVGTAAAKDVPTSGDASSSQVVMGNDSRLSDARTPAAHNQSANTITVGTLAGKVLAQNAAMATLVDPQIRNIYATSTDLTAGTTALTTGSIALVYE